MAVDFTKIEEVQLILSQNKAVRLLRKEHAALIIAFLWKNFKQSHRSSFTASDLATRLADFLFAANEESKRFTRTPRQYLESWTEDGFLRQFYGDQAEEATFELTPAAERALVWITELDQANFIGAESRLLQVFSLMKELALGTTEDKELKRQQLEAQKKAIETALQELEKDRLSRMDATQIQDRFFLIEEMSTRLLSDFRQIEENFRALNAKAREEQITKQDSRGAILDNIFDAQDAIMATDQGRTFNAFWNFLMNQQRQDELDEWIQQIFTLPELQSHQDYSPIPRLKMSLVEAGDRVNRTTDRLIEQLRRFLQSRSFMETKRTAQVISEIERLAIQVKQNPPDEKVFYSVEDKPNINLIMDRKPFEIPQIPKLNTKLIQSGQEEQVFAGGLYQQSYINPAELRGRIKTLLRGREQISLKEVTTLIPVEKGLSEIIAYFSVATGWEAQQKAVINTQKTQQIVYQKDDATYSVEIPETIFLS